VCGMAKSENGVRRGTKIKFVYEFEFKQTVIVWKDDRVGTLFDFEHRFFSHLIKLLTNFLNSADKSVDSFFILQLCKV